MSPDALLELVSFEGVVAQAPTGQTIRATAEWRNSSKAPIVVTKAVITGLAPGATEATGPYDDFTPATTHPVMLLPGDTLSLMAHFLPPAQQLGEWTVYPVYFDREGVAQNFPGSKFNLVVDHEYGSFENTIWPVSDPSDPPSDDHRFAYACYTKSATRDSAICRARYGLGSLPYQVNPNNLAMLQQQCEQDSGVFLLHACPTNQMLQLCWEDTRSPAWAFSCEYYGNPADKNPQMPGAAPDIVFYNDRYLGRDPQP